MKIHSLCPGAVLSFVMIFFASSCGTLQPATPTVDVIGTMSMGLAYAMQTQTAAAASPTPLPVTDTPVPTPTETQTPKPVWDPSNHTVVVVTNEAAGIAQAACWFGPGPSYNLESYITNAKKVQLLGVGSIPGWYVITNPYFHQPCWISAAEVKIPEGMDLSTFPVISP
jgi:hypothetical protein